MDCDREDVLQTVIDEADAHPIGDEVDFDDYSLQPYLAGRFDFPVPETAIVRRTESGFEFYLPASSSNSVDETVRAIKSQLSGAEVTARDALDLFRRLDSKLLHNQRKAVAELLRENDLPAEKTEALEGLLNMTDAISDFLVDRLRGTTYEESTALSS